MVGPSMDDDIAKIATLPHREFIVELEATVLQWIQMYLYENEESPLYVRRFAKATWDAIYQKFEQDSIVTRTHFASLCERLSIDLSKTVGAPAELIVEELQYEANKANLIRALSLKWWMQPRALLQVMWGMVLFITRPRYWLAVSLSSIVVFAFLYWVTGSLHGATPNSTLGFGDCLFSSMMAVTAGYGDIHPDSLGKLLLFAEAGIGYVLFGILISIVMKKIIRY